MRYKPMMNATRAHTSLTQFFALYERKKRMRWALWLNSAVSFSTCKGRFPLSRKFYRRRDVNLVSFRHVNKIGSGI